MTEFNKVLVESFKKDVEENAAEVKAAWKRGINKFAHRHADLMMAREYSDKFGANYQELVDFINNAYAL